MSSAETDGVSWIWGPAKRTIAAIDSKKSMQGSQKREGLQVAIASPESRRPAEYNRSLGTRQGEHNSYGPAFSGSTFFSSPPKILAIDGVDTWVYFYPIANSCGRSTIRSK